jgi:serine/threonine-protein kinase
VSEALPSATEIGALLPGFRIERQIGQGGMSVVYLAEDLGPLQRKRVAIKVLAPGLATDEHFRIRFVRESQIVANLEHPNVIPVYDAGQAGSLLYLVMRYVDGPDLRALLRSEGPLSPARVASLVGQVAGALDAAHRQGLVHRDVKPANVMVDRAGQPDEHCYLCDFGITKQAQSAETLTGTGQFVGTLDYIAPEQIEGRPLDPRTDVYALGCVVYQCLTGTVPYPLDTDMAKMLAHVREAPPSVRTVRGDVAPAVDAVIAKAMAKDPNDRFPSCGELAAALKDATSGPVPAGAETETRDAPRIPALEEQDPRIGGPVPRIRLSR